MDASPGLRRRYAHSRDPPAPSGLRIAFHQARCVSSGRSEAHSGTAPQQIEASDKDSVSVMHARAGPPGEGRKTPYRHIRLPTPVPACSAAEHRHRDRLDRMGQISPSRRSNENPVEFRRKGDKSRIVTSHDRPRFVGSSTGTASLVLPFARRISLTSRRADPPPNDSSGKIYFGGRARVLSA